MYLLALILPCFLWAIISSHGCEEEGRIRLVSHNDTAGTVEMCSGGEWNMVCDDFWGVADARVVCRQLGFSTVGPKALHKNSFGTPSKTKQPIVDDVDCIGNETRLIDCLHNTPGNCQHIEKAGAICKVLPSQIILLRPFPKDFLNVSTVPSCLGGKKALICNPENITLRDGVTGSEEDTIDPSEFLAWNASSGMVLQCEDGEPVREINLYFYQDLGSGMILPDFHLSGSRLDSQRGSRLNYTVVPQNDMAPSETPGVKSVTLVLAEPIITEDLKYLHIYFNLRDGQEQFVISELQACNTNKPSVVEPLVIELSSDLQTGPVVILPANQSQYPSGSNISLNCSIINQGEFQWNWFPENYTTHVSDDTHTTTIEVPVGRESVGKYTCTVSHLPTPISASFTVGIEQLLFTDEDKRSVTVETDNSATIGCILAGYVDQAIITEHLISWTFKGKGLDNNGLKYTISVTSEELPPYGVCGLGQLVISEPTTDDLGDYTCSYLNLTQTITLFSATVTLSPLQSTQSANVHISATNVMLLSTATASQVIPTPTNSPSISSNSPSTSNSPSIIIISSENTVSSLRWDDVRILLGGCFCAILLLTVILVTLVVAVIKRQKSAKAKQYSISANNALVSSPVNATSYSQKEEPLYDSVLPAQPYERIELKENSAYTCFEMDKVQCIHPQMLPNVAYEEILKI